MFVIKTISPPIILYNALEEINTYNISEREQYSHPINKYVMKSARSVPCIFIYTLTDQKYQNDRPMYNIGHFKLNAVKPAKSYKIPKLLSERN